MHHTHKFLQELFHKSNHCENIIKKSPLAYWLWLMYTIIAISYQIQLLSTPPLFNSKISCSVLPLRNQQTLPIKDKEPLRTFFHTSNSQRLGGDANGVTGFVGFFSNHSIWVRIPDLNRSTVCVFHLFFFVVQCSLHLSAHMPHMFILHFA